MTEKLDNTRNKISGHEILAEITKDSEDFQWDGTFEQYLNMVISNSSIVKLSHALVNEAIKTPGVYKDLKGEPLYRIFDEKMFGLESALEKVARYFEAAAKRLEVRKRILLLLGPPASGKSSIIDIIKRGLEDYTKTDSGAVYTIQGCPMQEDPLHLVTGIARHQMSDDHGIHIEGELCFHCRFLLEHDYQGNPSDMPITRVTFSESRARGIGYYLANNPNLADPSVLVGSHNELKLDGDRQEVAARAFRLDGELNVANRGMMEYVEIFKADRTLLTTLLSLAQEQLIKMEKFGSVYADEVIVAHSNEGDFNTFAMDPSSEALKDRIIAIKVPYNLRVSQEVKILKKMIGQSTVHDVHIAPLTLSVVSIFAILSRLEAPSAQGMSLLDKVKLYDGGQVANFTHKDVVDMQRHHPNEGMGGISPRYILNRIGSIASAQVPVVTPLAALDSMWNGLKENISLDTSDILTYVDFITETVKEYNRLAIRELQLAFEETFYANANALFENYLNNIEAYCSADDNGRSPKVFSNERDMQELERAIRITARNKDSFRNEINNTILIWKQNNVDYDYRSEPRLKAAIENRLLPAPRKIEKALSKPRFARQRVEWKSRYDGILNRLVVNFGYTTETGEDLIQYALHTIKNRAVVRTPRNEGVEWLWPLYPQKLKYID
ncbi:MAG: serine protein kinase [Chloroflexi bacterium]|nr:MAG: serine protein kinase [Chloroflexota bacterium]